ncbi:MAG: exodeoxyribonuclease V subunit beta [Desulfosoma sp.]
MPPLDPLTLPLDGVRLIEASAGTGKTHNIVTLFLRLLLEKGADISRILVVTFTNAATEELRGRLRERLRTAWAEAAHGGPKDPVLAAVWSTFDEAQKFQAQQRLWEAVCRMDEAAVFTIHGFCQRMLQEFAFESAIPFDWDVLPDDRDLYREAAADFWRLLMKTADTVKARWLLETWDGPEGLLEALDVLRSPVGLRICPEPTEKEAADFAELAELYKKMCSLWGKCRSEIEGILRHGKGLDRRSYTGSVVQNALDAMEAIIQCGMPPLSLPDSFKRFTPSMLAEKSKGGPAPSHSFFDLCGRYEKLLHELVTSQRLRILHSACHFIRKAVDDRKAAERSLAFDDLLRRFDKALSGPVGPRLAEAVRQKYSVALIDEFQDTDPVQYQIFKRIYIAPDGPQPLCLIGDPKQAIYSFRGADIFTYMGAKRDAGPENVYTMTTNWRSSSGLVRAVNHLFSRHPYPFVFHGDIPFHEVQSAGRADQEPLQLDGAVPAALQIRFIPTVGLVLTREGFITAEAASRAAAADCAGVIVRLLNLSQEGRACIGTRPIQARDMAVLVRSHREGRMVQEALRRRGVASVSLQRESVFAAPEAADVMAVLSAVAEPADDRLLRTALATEILGWDALRLSALEDDETLMEDVQNRFHRYRDLWHRHGFLAAFMTLLKEENIPAHVRALPAGERRLTNLLHLAELLHAASASHRGTDRLLRWFADRLHKDDAPEEEQLRLESDENLVQVVTIHKSKGLEYPIVFVPFPWTIKPRYPKDSDAVRFHDPDDLALCVDLGSDRMDDHRQLAYREDLAECMRLVYVALTRAKHLCITSWGWINEAAASAMAWLLFPKCVLDPVKDRPESVMGTLAGEEKLREALAELARSTNGAVALEQADWHAAEPWVQKEERDPVFQARTFSTDLGIPWRITSYTHMALGAEPHTPDYDAATDGAEGDEDASQAVDPIFLFPRGPRAGRCLHEIFEKIDFSTPSPQDAEDIVPEALSRHGLSPLWVKPILSMVENVLTAPLPELSARLRHIGLKDRLNELEFHFPIVRLDPAALAQALQDHAFYKPSVEGLTFEALQGLMRGFIDLVFRCEGRYFIADYKSNHLGNRVEDYHQKRLKRAMHEHRYPLQMLLYTVALHRYLSFRLPGYEYERDFGGVYYLFVRGMRPESAEHPGVFFHRPAKDVIHRLDALFRSPSGPSGNPSQSVQKSVFTGA